MNLILLELLLLWLNQTIKQQPTSGKTKRCCCFEPNDQFVNPTIHMDSNCDLGSSYCFDDLQLDTTRLETWLGYGHDLIWLEIWWLEWPVCVYFIYFFKFKYKILKMFKTFNVDIETVWVLPGTSACWKCHRHDRVTTLLVKLLVMLSDQIRSSSCPCHESPLSDSEVSHVKVKGKLQDLLIKANELGGKETLLID